METSPLDAVTAWALAAHAAGVQVLLNAAPAAPLPPELLAAVDVLIVNEGELTVLAGAQGSIDEQLQRLPVPTVVVTLGACGCLARTPQGRFEQPAFKVSVVDTTGAGEAAAAAALACTRPGAQAGIPTRAEVLMRLAC